MEPLPFVQDPAVSYTLDGVSLEIKRCVRMSDVLDEPISLISGHSYIEPVHDTVYTGLGSICGFLLRHAARVEIALVVLYPLIFHRQDVAASPESARTHDRIMCIGILFPGVPFRYTHRNL